MDYLEGRPLPERLTLDALQFTVSEFEDVGVVELSSEEEDSDVCGREASRDPTSKERAELGLPLSFGTSKRQNAPKKRRRCHSPRPPRNKEAAALRKTLGRRFVRYWLQRYSLFSRFDEGIRLDQEGWYSVTPECLAQHHAQKCSRLSAPLLVLDACCGVGGNAIQFAAYGHRVVAVDLDRSRLHMALNNAHIYGVEDMIEFLQGDVFEVGRSMRPDVVFLSPPWGGPDYQHQDYTPLERGSDLGQYVEKTMELVDAWESSTKTLVMLYLPRNVDLCVLIEWMAARRASRLEVEVMIINAIVKAVTVYFNG